MLVFSIVGVLAVTSIGVPLFMGRARANRWGADRVVREVDVAPFRSAPLHDLKARSAPVGVRVVSGLAIAWSLITGFIFAPAGLLLMLATGGTGNSVRTLGSLGMFGVSLSGFALAIHMCRHALGLLRGQVEKDANRMFFRHGIGHHIAVVIAVSTALFGDYGWDGVVGFTVAACLAGIGIVACLAGTAREVLDERARVRVAGLTPEAPPLVENDPKQAAHLR